MSEWILVDERLPKSLFPVLAFSNGVIRAFYAAQHMLELHEDAYSGECLCAECQSADYRGDSWAAPGWYECCDSHDEEPLGPIEDVTHWMPLPTPPGVSK